MFSDIIFQNKPVFLIKLLVIKKRVYLSSFLYSTDSLKHSRADDYGENIAYSCSGNKVVAAVNDSVNDW